MQYVFSTRRSICTLSCSGRGRRQATVPHKHLFGGSCWSRWSRVTGGSSFLWRRDLTVLTPSQMRHFRFTSSLFLKLSGIKEVELVSFDAVWLLCFLFYCTHPLLLSKTRLHGPGGWTPDWRGVITVPYQWLTEARVPPACHRPVALSSPGQFAARRRPATLLLTSGLIETSVHILFLFQM